MSVIKVRTGPTGVRSRGPVPSEAAPQPYGQCGGVSRETPSVPFGRRRDSELPVYQRTLSAAALLPYRVPFRQPEMPVSELSRCASAPEVQMSRSGPQLTALRPGPGAQCPVPVPRAPLRARHTTPQVLRVAATAMTCPEGSPIPAVCGDPLRPRCRDETLHVSRETCQARCIRCGESGSCSDSWATGGRAHRQPPARADASASRGPTLAPTYAPDRGGLPSVECRIRRTTSGRTLPPASGPEEEQRLHSRFAG